MKNVVSLGPQQCLSLCSLGSRRPGTVWVKIGVGFVKTKKDPETHTD